MIGGVVLTVAAILLMILCRRSSALTLKAMGNGEKHYQNGGGGSSTTATSKAMTTTGTSTSYTGGESDVAKSSGNGTALLDASLANDNEEWEGNEEGALLNANKKHMMHQQNFSNFQMVRGKKSQKYQMDD